MKPLVKLLLLSLCLLLFTHVSAQVNKLGEAGNIKGNPSTSSTDYTTTQTSSGSSSVLVRQEFGIPSSIYFNDWTAGKVVLKDNTVYEDWLLRYNIYSQQMQFINEDDTSAFGNPEEVLSITFDDHTFLFDDFICENNVKRKGYLELLVDGNCKLYMYRCISYRYVDECAEPRADYVKEEFYMTKRYFIAENNGPAVLLPEKKKELISMMDNENKDIKSYIKDNKIKLCNEENLKELFTFYNSE
ncbi:MAG: hypothetical protein K8R74_03440 [Bacteroidales bacterium]|nr:hypothetical protein [Bacteroidales bacterium]